MKKLLKYVKPFLWIMILAIVLKATATIFELLVPKAMGTLINHALYEKDEKMITQLIIQMAVYSIGCSLFTYFAHYYSAKFALMTGQSIRKVIYDRIQKLNIASIEEIETSSLITRVTNDVENIQNAFSTAMKPLIRGPMQIVGGLFLSVMISPKLTLIILACMACVILVSLSVYKYTTPLFRKIQKSIDRLTLVLGENLSGIRLVKSYNKCEYEKKRFKVQVDNVKENELKVGKFNALIQPSIGFISNLALALVSFAGAYVVAGEEIEVGDLMAITTYINIILSSAHMIPRMMLMISRASISGGRISDIIELNDITSYGEASEPENSDTILEFRNVTFTYANSIVPSIKNVSFKIKKGQTVGITGDTGCGKSTLLSLILRIYEPQEGTILFEGKDIKSYDKNYLRTHISAALQQFNMLKGSIEKNIILDLPKDEQRLEKAIRTAQISDLINKHNNKLSYDITQSGTNLSGGQKQRISIARCLYREADLTILDDVSSGLDYKTDLMLRRSIKQNYLGSTMLIISQRQSSVRHADIILVLEDGSICGSGSHEELMQSCEKYREINETQSAQQNGGIKIEA